MLLSSPFALGFAAPVAPMGRAVRSVASPVMGMEAELGAIGPLGYWDPLGFVRCQSLRAGPAAIENGRQGPDPGLLLLLRPPNSRTASRTTARLS